MASVPSGADPPGIGSHGPSVAVDPKVSVGIFDVNLKVVGVWLEQSRSPHPAPRSRSYQRSGRTGRARVRGSRQVALGQGPGVAGGPAVSGSDQQTVGCPGRWLVVAGRDSPPGCCLRRRPHRLAELAPLLRFARSLRMYGPAVDADSAAAPSAWELDLGSARFTLTLSPEPFGPQRAGCPRCQPGTAGSCAEARYADSQTVARRACRSVGL